jgi:hypothetical protein
LDFIIPLPPLRLRPNHFAFAEMNTGVKALMEMTHVSHVLHTYRTVKDAEAALAQLVG